MTTVADTDELEMLRTNIDDLDLQIANLILIRKRVSQSIITRKVERGEPRFDLSREVQVHDNYRKLLGWHGGLIAAEILGFSKGDN
jgi:chorismate mutase